LQLLETTADPELLKVALQPPGVTLLREPRYYQAIQRHVSSDDRTVRLLAGAILSLYPGSDNLPMALQWTRSEDERVVRQGVNILTTAGRTDATTSLQRVKELMNSHKHSWRTMLYLSRAMSELSSVSRDRAGYFDRSARYYRELNESK